MPGRAKVGEVRRHTLLGTTATYRVIAVGDERITVEVIDAPGLAVGHRMVLTARSVMEMDLVIRLDSPGRDRRSGE